MRQENDNQAFHHERNGCIHTTFCDTHEKMFPPAGEPVLARIRRCSNAMPAAAGFATSPNAPQADSQRAEVPKTSSFASWERGQEGGEERSRKRGTGSEGH